MKDLTLLQARNSLNCSNPKVWDLLNKGELEGYYVGRQIRITSEALDDYKRRNRFVPKG